MYERYPVFPSKPLRFCDTLPWPSFFLWCHLFYLCSDLRACTLSQSQASRKGPELGKSFLRWGILAPNLTFGCLAPLGPWFMYGRRFLSLKAALCSPDLAGVVQTVPFVQRTSKHPLATSCERRWRRLVCIRSEGCRGQSARSMHPRSHSPNLGGAALSARYGAEYRALPGAGECLQFPAGAQTGRLDPILRRTPQTRPRPRRPREAGGALRPRRAELCGAASPRARGGTEGQEGRERKPDRPACEELHATGGRPGRPGPGLFVGWSLAASADRPEAAALSWRAEEGCLPRLPARLGPRMRGGDARGQGRALSPGAAAAGRALCPWGPGARQLPGFHLPPAGPHQTPAPRLR